MKKYLFPLILASCIMFLSFQANGMITNPVTRFESLSSDSSTLLLMHTYDVLKYKMDMNLYANYTTPYPKTFRSKIEITFKVDSTLNYIKLNAVNTSLQIDSVRKAGVSFTHLNDTLKIMLNRTYVPGEVATVRISYKHLNITDNAFYVSGGYVFTDCPPEGARKWFPCWDKPYDKAQTDIRVKVPATVLLGSTGYLADSTKVADTIYYRWISENPVATYLVTISSKITWDLDVIYWTKPGTPPEQIPMRFYHRSTENPSYIESIMGDMNDFYSEKFGVYPHEKVGFATLNNTFPWGGMENQSMVNLCTNCWDEDLIAHEHAHQWFGDLITCGTWADIWLNEGFGTFCYPLWKEYKQGYASYKSQINSYANYYLSHNPGWPIYNPEWAIHTPGIDTLYHTAIIYNKGACVLHMLRYVLGDSLFFNVMNSYGTDTNYMFKYAVTTDFIAKVNEVSGEDMTWFFDQWVYAPDHPEYYNEYGFQALGCDKWNVIFTTNQIQTGTVFFKMPVELKVIFADNTDTTVTFMNDSNQQTFMFIVQKEPVSLIFDPDREIVIKQATTVLGMNEAVPMQALLGQNIPNPAQGITRIPYEIKEKMKVTLSLTDSFGRTIATLADAWKEPGKYEVTVDTSIISTGICFYKMETTSGSFIRKMVVVK